MDFVYLFLNNAQRYEKESEERSKGDEMANIWSINAKKADFRVGSTFDTDAGPGGGVTLQRSRTEKQYSQIKNANEMEDIHNETAPEASRDADMAAVKPQPGGETVSPAMYQPLTPAMADEPEDEDDFLASVPRSVWGDVIEI